MIKSCHRNISAEIIADHRSVAVHKREGVVDWSPFDPVLKLKVEMFSICMIFRCAKLRFIFTLLEGAPLITDANDGPEQGPINIGFIIQQLHDECGIKPSENGILNGKMTEPVMCRRLI